MSLDLSQLYARMSPRMANTRGGTSWQQQYAPQMAGASGGPAAVPNAGMQAGSPAQPRPGEARAREIMSMMGMGRYAPPSATPSAPRLGATSPGMGVRQPGAQGNPNTQQMSPQAMAMLAEFQRRAALSSPQRMAEDRGVFAGQQQAAPMAAPPPMNLPQLYAGGR